jgi:hypothetical protein
VHFTNGFRGPIMRISILAGARALALCLTLAAGGSAFAFPVTWTLSGATFVDGGTASGSFVYDADYQPGQQQALTSFSISVDGGDTVVFPPVTYSPANAYGSMIDGGAGDFGAIFSLNAPGETRGIRIPAVALLTDAGGTLAINAAGAGAGECYNCGPQRSFASGNLVGTAAPAITSAGTAHFDIGSAVNFTVTSTGAPTPALSVAGPIPPGVSFVDNGDGTGTFSGTATAPGSYALTITAANGISPDAVQPFILNEVAAAGPAPTPTLGEFGMLACIALLLLAAARRLVPHGASRR